MKKSLNIFALAIAIVVAQACGSKSKNNEEYATTETPVVKATEVSQLTVAEKRAKLEKKRAAQEEKRRLAYEQAAKANPTYKDSEGNVVYNKAESNPSFTGGDKAMMKYLNDNIVYPSDAKEKGVEGTVFVDFIVASNGSVREAAVSDAPGEDVDQSLRDEAIRVVTSMPKWVPGRQRGAPVNVKYSLPISFQMN